jgi:hypothetical protein
LLAISGVNVLARTAELVPFYIFLQGGWAIRQVWRCEWNAFLGSRPLPAKLREHPVFCPLLQGQNLGQNLFCSLTENG